MSVKQSTMLDTFMICFYLLQVLFQLLVQQLQFQKANFQIMISDGQLLNKPQTIELMMKGIKIVKIMFQRQGTVL